ncbi:MULTISPECIES: hypothetical protein [Acidithiobacillus]|jgi:hypothetical protein|nr:MULTISPECIES: hypothetical protein [Acidithiobacillus]AUW32225.1 hypothetical protein A5904_03835 [Acidithiobacillus caldus]MBU2731073.1 hypothetical protein [Acidithiobacillus caldus]MBU2735056.1 hypothetical protein [Acidithiobacillus caldus ATCC 51756]MBU2746463.1 hypothetical protein [Acidithiobacillus caldus]MBU2764125.1 hypothetical protein [Acidithiobacillus caldus]
MIRRLKKQNEHRMRRTRGHLAMVVSLILAAFSAAAVAETGYIAHANVSTYVCQTRSQARMQDINPDYLVPGCSLRETAVTDQGRTTIHRGTARNKMED